MEYLKSLPYDSLAIAEAVYKPPTCPVLLQTVNGIKYKIVTTISYIDDAFDGAGRIPPNFKTNLLSKLSATKRFTGDGFKP